MFQIHCKRTKNRSGSLLGRFSVESSMSMMDDARAWGHFIYAFHHDVGDCRHDRCHTVDLVRPMALWSQQYIRERSGGRNILIRRRRHRIPCVCVRCTCGCTTHAHPPRSAPTMYMHVVRHATLRCSSMWHANDVAMHMHAMRDSDAMRHDAMSRINQTTRTCMCASTYLMCARHLANDTIVVR